MVYTSSDDDPFDWDEYNVEHVAAHGHEWWETEQIILDPDRLFLQRADTATEDRWVVIGKTESGRVLVVVYTRRGRRIRVITARAPNTREARFFSRRRPN
jgi:uncharacterized DUF497 family protein